MTAGRQTTFTNNGHNDDYLPTYSEVMGELFVHNVYSILPSFRPISDQTKLSSVISNKPPPSYDECIRSKSFARITSQSKHTTKELEPAARENRIMNNWPRSRNSIQLTSFEADFVTYVNNVNSGSMARSPELELSVLSMTSNNFRTSEINEYNILNDTIEPAPSVTLPEYFSVIVCSEARESAHLAEESDRRKRSVAIGKRLGKILRWIAIFLTILFPPAIALFFIITLCV